MSPLASSGPVAFFEGWKFVGNFTTVDLIAAYTNALNGGCSAGGPITSRTSRLSECS